MLELSKLPACVFTDSGFKTKKAAMAELKKRKMTGEKFKNRTQLTKYLKSISKLPVLPSTPRPKLPVKKPAKKPAKKKPAKKPAKKIEMKVEKMVENTICIYMII